MISPQGRAREGKRKLDRLSSRSLRSENLKQPLMDRVHLEKAGLLRSLSQIVQATKMKKSWLGPKSSLLMLVILFKLREKKRLSSISLMISLRISFSKLMRTRKREHKSRRVKAAKFKSIKCKCQSI